MQKRRALAAASREGRESAMRAGGCRAESGDCASNMGTGTGSVPEFLVGLVVCLAAGGCGGGGTGGLPAPEFHCEGALIAATAPAQQDFILRATLPVPRGTFQPGQATVPLTVGDYDRSPLRTQVEVVSRYPVAADGADVVEVMARVQRPPGAQAGDRLFYQVSFESQAQGSFEPEAVVRDLLAAPGALELATVDVFAHRYAADLYRKVREGHPDVRTLRDGGLVREHATHEVLEPETPVVGNQGTLPHMMGAHAYVTTYAGERFFTLDLQVHNGMDGLDGATSTDDALQELYFRELNLRLPPGWRVLHAFDNPLVGSPITAGGWRYHPLIEALPAGKLHVMHRQARFVRRLAIVVDNDPSAEARARATLDQDNLGFCTPGTGPGGLDWCSWWSPAGARYFPQNHALPRLDHVGLENIRYDLASLLGAQSEQIANGDAGGYPFLSGNLGWAHPWGVSYGGMSGGVEIVIFDGIATAAAASTDGYRLMQLTMRGYSDRHPTALYGLDGEPTSVEDVLIPSGPAGPYVPCDFFLVPGNSGDPFGFTQAPLFQIDAAVAMGLTPDYDDELDEYSPIDFQHHTRYTRSLKVLAWLGNDSLAKDGLRAAAECFRLSFHQYPNASNGVAQGTSLLYKLRYVQTTPGNGLEFGRGEAWGLDCASSAYALADPEWRDRVRPWFGLVEGLLAAGQSTCTGTIMAQQINHNYGGVYRQRQSMESAYIDNALRGMNETVFRGVDAGRSARVEQTLLRSLDAAVQPPFWLPGNPEPSFNVAVGPADSSLPLYCSDWPGQFGFDSVTYYSSLAYGYQLSGNPEFLNKATQLAGGGSLLYALEAMGLDNLQNMAAMLALMQGHAGY